MAEEEKSVTVMVIEDHDLTRAALRTLLPDHMTIIGEAATGQAALTCLKALAAPPDLILLDLFLPDIDGYLLLHQLRPCAPHSRIVILTAQTHTTFRSRCLRAGAVGYLTKSADRATFLKALDTAMHKPLPKLRPRAGYQALVPTEQASDAEERIADLWDNELCLWLEIARGRDLRDISQSFGLKYNTTQRLRTALCTKLACQSDLALTQLAVSTGLMSPLPVQASRTSPDAPLTRL